MDFPVPDIPGEAWSQGGFFVLLFIIVISAIGFLWVIVAGCRWLGAKILEPARDRFFKHLDAVEEKLGATAPAINGLTDAINKACKFNPDHYCKHDE